MIDIFFQAIIAIFEKDLLMIVLCIIFVAWRIAFVLLSNLFRNSLFLYISRMGQSEYPLDDKTHSLLFDSLIPASVYETEIHIWARSRNGIKISDLENESIVLRGSDDVYFFSSEITRVKYDHCRATTVLNGRDVHISFFYLNSADFFVVKLVHTGRILPSQVECSVVCGKFFVTKTPLTEPIAL